MVRAPASGEPLSRSRLPQLFNAPQPPAAEDFLPMNDTLMTQALLTIVNANQAECWDGLIE